MDRNQKAQSDQPLIAAAKDSCFAARCALILLALSLSTSCQSPASKPVVNPPPPDYLLSKGARQLTLEGENENPVFSPNGDRVLFISRKRSRHKNGQLYEIHLLRNTERRVTFQDGEIRTPAYLSDDRIVYSSSTDEIKENLAEFFNASSVVNDRPPLELYESDLYGNDIERLTHYPGFDAEPVFFEDKKPFLIFTSNRGGSLGLMKYDYKTKSTTFFLSDKTKDRYSPTITDDMKNIAWLEKDPKEKKTTFVMSPLNKLEPKILKQTEHEVRDLRFVPEKSQLLYSVQRSGLPAHIEIFDFEKNCTQVVFSGADSLVQPHFSPGTPGHIVFTRVLKETKQIYIVDWPSDLGPCLETQP